MTDETKNTMLGLFRYRYDWCEWEHIACVSNSKELLEERYEKMREHYKTLSIEPDPLIPLDQHEVFSDNEKGHYCIRPVEVL